MNPADLDLLQAYLDGEMSEEQTRALEARLKIEPDLAERLMLLARNEATLLEWARAMVVARNEHADAGSFSANGVPARPARILPIGRNRFTRAALVAATIAALAVCLLWKVSG